MDLILNKTRVIDGFFREHFKNDSNVLSVFVVGSMYDMNIYKPRRNNDYDIRLLVKKMDGAFLREVEKVQKQLLGMLDDENCHVEFNNLVGLVNHNLSVDRVNLLVHLLIHELSDLEGFLPATHQYCYSHFYRIVSGQDYLKPLKKVTYTADYLIDCHEGIDYCCDMLERKVYKYLEWVSGDSEKVEFVYKEKNITEDLICESVFYSLKNVFKNLYHISKDYYEGIKEVEYILRITKSCWDDEEFIYAIYERDEEYLNSLGDGLFSYTIELLKKMRKLIQEKKV